MGLMKYTISYVLLGLFVISLLSFVVNFAVDNDSDVILSSDSDFQNLKTQYESNVSSFKDTVDGTTGNLADSTIAEGTDTVKTGGLFTGGLGTMKNLAFSSIGAGFNKIFGGDPQFNIIFVTLLAVIIFIGAMYAIKAWLGRDPE